MKKTILFSTLLGTLSFQTWAQTIDTVSVGASYANQKWYSLLNDEQGSQPKDNWDIAFEITGFSASILANVQKANFAVYKAPYKIANFATLDTTGINNWQLLYNSDTSWTIGAFNKGGVFSNPNYLGWGVYDVNTHIITGDSCYVVKLSANSYKKLKIDNLSGGVYSFSYSDINGANAQTQTITKTNYPGKNFAYFDMTSNTAIDREPVSANWDLTFVKYISFVPPSGTPYGVTGVLCNKGVRVAQASNVAGPATYTNYLSHTFNSAINEIGYDWKEINMSTFLWEIKNDTVYFAKDKAGNIWKLRFTKFSGSASGNFIFSKEKIVNGPAVGISDTKAGTLFTLAVYPNPTDNNSTLLLSSEKEDGEVLVSVMDIGGKVVLNQTLNIGNGFYQHNLPTSELKSGVYFITLKKGTETNTLKLIKN